MTLAEGASIAAYRLLERIGEGGMGIVWRALDTRLNREIAIKFLPEEFAEDPRRLARFEAEAQAVAALNHPNIVTIHSIEEAEGFRFFTMELIRGWTLRTLMTPEGLPLEELLRVAVPLCDALGSAHAGGITHRDLKPRNVMVTESGVVKVLDFGLARSAGSGAGLPFDERETETLTGSGRVCGTAAYMSPEQVRGEDPAPASDLFSLGVLLYEMATGRRPFRGETFADIHASILRDTPTPAHELRTDLPRQLGRLIASCLEKDPSKRPASALEVRDEIKAVDRAAMKSPTTGVPSIAVLPFADMSPAKDQDWFCEGIAEEILNALAKLEGLRVVSRTSSFRFKGASVDSREIGDRLGVGALLDGSVRKSDDRLRITATLIGVADGCELWSERYDRELRDVFAIQEDIAGRIVEALRGALSPHERRALRQVATGDVRAYEFYLRGRKFFNQYGRQPVEFALKMFTRATEIDPNYALAWAGMADVHSYVYLNVDRNESRREAAEAASLRALELDPDLAEAHVARGVALSLAGRHDASKTSFETATRLDPRLFEARYFFARDAYVRGDLEGAARLYEQAMELRPEDYQSPLLVAQVYDTLGRAVEAAAARRRGVDLVQARLDIAPDDVRALYMGANGLVALGDQQRGLDWARQASEIAPDDTMLLYNVACIFALAGEVEPALDCLERAVRLGFANRAWVERDTDLDAVRDHPRYLRLIERWV